MFDKFFKFLAYLVRGCEHPKGYGRLCYIEVHPRIGDAKKERMISIWNKFLGDTDAKIRNNNDFEDVFLHGTSLHRIDGMLAYKFYSYVKRAKRPGFTLVIEDRTDIYLKKDNNDKVLHDIEQKISANAHDPEEVIRLKKQKEEIIQLNNNMRWF